jgi:hypothetical protein
MDEEKWRKVMAAAHEEDVVIAFRQAVEEEMEKMQSGGGSPHATEVFPEGASTEDALKALVAHHLELEREVALLRTIVLRLVSDPLD